jgi:ectoine hydroxylase-related dioxygenase (phytanoyl-CoA dioxygenase family)
MTLTETTIQSYRQNGFTVARGLLSRDDAARYRAAVLSATPQLKANADFAALHQFVNVWRHDPVLRELTLLPRLGAWAAQLAGVPLRLWHDHVLMKRPHKTAPTEFHQDQPYWPHANSRHPISAWIALGDVPVEKGCMSFIPGSHHRTDLPMQNLGDPRSLFSVCPALEYEPRVTIPLRAGDCTFHHGRCAHMAGPNQTDDVRVAHVVVFIDATTTYAPLPHPVTDPLGLKEGDLLDGELFPLIQ